MVRPEVFDCSPQRSTELRIWFIGSVRSGLEILVKEGQLQRAQILLLGLEVEGVRRVFDDLQLIRYAVLLSKRRRESQTATRALLCLPCHAG